MADIPSAALPEIREILKPEIRAAIARVDSARRMRPLGMPASTAPLSTIYEILARTPEEGTDLPAAMDAAMQSFVILSHQRRLLAITLAAALPEIETLRADRDRLQRRVEKLEAGLRERTRLLVQEHHARQIVRNGLDTPLCICVICEDFRAALTSETPHAK